MAANHVNVSWSIMMFLLSHTSHHNALPSLYWRSQARLPTGHPLWPARRGTCPVQVLEAQEISGNSQRVGPPGQSMMRTGQAPCQRYREVSGSAEGPYWADGPRREGEKP